LHVAAHHQVKARAGASLRKQKIGQADGRRGVSDCYWRATRRRQGAGPSKYVQIFEQNSSEKPGKRNEMVRISRRPPRICKFIFGRFVENQRFMGVKIWIPVFDVWVGKAPPKREPSNSIVASQTFVNVLFLFLTIAAALSRA
jgi:hypothetical protein